MQNLLETALRIINQYALVFYGLGVLGLLFYLNRARSAYRQMRLTPFPIEREEASANARDALVIAVIFGAIIGTTFYIDRILLAPQGENAADDGGIAVNGDDSENGGIFGLGGDDDNGDDGDTPSILPTRTATSPAIGPTPEQSPTPSETPVVIAVATTAPPPTIPPFISTPVESPTPEPSPTPAPQESPTPAPSPIPTQPPQPTAPPAPAVPAASCPTTGVQISAPGNGAVVNGTVGINGTADIANFQFYKVEYSAGTNQSSFSSIGDIIAAPVRGGRLMSWNTGGFPKGVYALRLTVVDISGNFPPPCTVFVVLQ